MHEYIDDGVSGQKGYKKRPALTAMLQNLDNVDVILFIKLDRWFRSVKLYYEAQDVLDAHNVSWVATQEDYETVTSAGKFKVNIMLSIAQAESERTSERVKFVFETKRAAGESCTGKLPLGYKLIDKRVAIDEEKLPVVKDVFSTYVDTRSITAVRSMMFDKYGLTYTPFGIKNVIGNKAYIGQEPFQQIIDRDLFVRAQEIRAARSQRHVRTDRVYIFTGLVYCHQCGGRMRSSFTCNRKYYNCAVHYEHGNIICTHGRYHREADIEKYLLDNLLYSIDDYNLQVQKQLDEGAKAVLKKDPAKIKKKMEKLKDLYLDDLITKDVYERDYRALENELDALAAYAPHFIKKLDVEESLKLYATFNDETKKAFWSRTVRRVDVDVDGNIFFIPAST